MSFAGTARPRSTGAAAVLAGALGLFAGPPYSEAATVTYTAVSLGGNNYQLNYTVSSAATDPTWSELTIFVDFTLSNLSNPVSPLAWSPLVVPPSPLLGSGPTNGYGYFDVLATGSGLAPGTSVSGLAFTASYSGTGTPSAPQYFAFVDSSHGYAVLQSGYATAVPAPVVPVSASATSVNAGQSVTLTASAIGTGPFTYQWYQGASGVTTAPVAGGTGAVLTLVPPSGTTSYWVKTTGPTGVVEDSAAVTITATVTVQNQDNRAGADGPLPPWAPGLLVVAIVAVGSRRLGRPR
jgi:Ig-like domain CHU_C associated